MTDQSTSEANCGDRQWCFLGTSELLLLHDLGWFLDLSSKGSHVVSKKQWRMPHCHIIHPFHCSENSHQYYWVLHNEQW